MPNLILLIQTNDVTEPSSDTKLDMIIQRLPLNRNEGTSLEAPLPDIKPKSSVPENAGFRRRNVRHSDIIEE